MIMINFLSVVSCLTNMWLNLEGNTKQSLIQVGSAPRSNPLLYTIFDGKGTPVVYVLLTNSTPFIHLV